ncbi:antitoxin YefM [Nocardia neocaledoniensis NBRC 108232]|uniref:Antitoxin n=1 Tax=Nocardia neocaledoniensis TaxID=236511 RepID=A0A317NLN0_9NOCA|nr:type II toxin-antitoxin system prevent-host-death family antitoxin [Nocardia neocaledoniensis]PWV76361.1 antitoxin YefM [Nocardia neocaledoniensis]GEM33624.1 antitoxin YefM [Nocardia neocaledoniensis NBRC 108232]
MTTAITATDARKGLFPLIEQVNQDHTAIEIVSKKGNAVLLSKEDYDAMVETAYLLSSPANAARLLRSLEATRRGEYTERALVE